jgi:hypothetical protein
LACNIDSLELASFPTQAPARFGETACQSAGCDDGRRAAVAITTPRSEGTTAVNEVGGTLAGYQPAEPLAGDVNHSGHEKDGQARGLGRRVRRQPVGLAALVFSLILRFSLQHRIKRAETAFSEPFSDFHRN